MEGVDRLGKVIKEKDIVAIADYNNSMLIGKITNINDFTIRFRTFSYAGRELELEDLKQEPIGWYGWTYLKNSKHRLLILRRGK